MPEINDTVMMWANLFVKEICADINRGKNSESYQIRKDGPYNNAKQEITEYIL
jgi:hypothetical protein